MRRLLLLSLALVLSANVACVSSVARTNAHIEPGFDVAFSGGGQLVEGVAPSAATPEVFPHLEVDVQGGFRNDAGYGMALQLKVPALIVFTTLDFYLELPSESEDLFYGVGVELGAASALYAVITKHVGDFYFSFTPRISKSIDQSGLLINPQLSLGVEEFADLSAFVSFAHHTGKGYDFNLNLFATEPEPDYRKNFGLAGIMLRF